MIRRSWIYPIAGVVVALGIGAWDGVRGVTGATAAWLLCGVPLLFDTLRRKVANRPGVATTNTTRGLMVLPPGMLFRAAFVLLGSALLYLLAKEWLGIGYWFAILVCYQVALAVVVLRSRDRDGQEGFRSLA